MIANEAKADLFISIHANSSPDHSARGVETYYLNFSASPGAMEVASRENALAQENVHDLADMVQRIARNEKIEESKDLAGDIQQSLSARMKKNSPSIRDRGVRKAPFVVLIGANMPPSSPKFRSSAIPPMNSCSKKATRASTSPRDFIAAWRRISKAPIASRQPRQNLARPKPRQAVWRLPGTNARLAASKYLRDS